MDVQAVNEYLEKFIPPTIALLITGLISVIIGLYLEKFKSRLVFLKYRIISNSLATTIQNEFWGNIEVQYRGRKTNHLSFVTIELVNDSNVDLENVNIDIWVDTESQILGNDGYYDNSGNSILLEQGYYSYYTQIIQKNQEDIENKSTAPDHVTPQQLINETKWISTNKKFNLPVFNRHTSIRINLLIENFKGQVPAVNVSILHKSVKLITQRDKAEEDKRLGVNMIVWGLIIFILSCFFVQRFYLDATTPIIIIGITGVLQLFIGLIIYRLINTIRQMLL
ncbi:hypothetical protein [Chryseobacterium shandongense]|uniref:hypothetical protein n=1 Tax=Chryseobacterium shandongense TaxID=1493872 RepID=UPI000F4F7710|nr:hypothetical protein [Chryseobacterium shandongense]AZA56204.1 hypothetical protein EG350_02880 [Chryseobacterium shandongense]